MQIVPISELDMLLGYTCSKASSPKETEEYNGKKNAYLNHVKIASKNLF